MRRILLLILCCSAAWNLFAQTTVTSGDWTDPTVWSGGAVPAAGGTVTVDDPLTINTNLSPTGIWTFSANTTDQPGAPAYTFNPNAGTNTITIDAGTTVTFEGGTSGTPNAFGSGTIDIYGTLILGYTELANSGNLKVNIKSTGILIINGDLVNKNNSGTFTVDGALIVNGDFDNQTGSVTVSGGGSINTTGSLTTTGGSTVFGTTNDCNSGPCSGTTLTCSFDNYISPSAATTCSGTTTVTFTSNPVTSNAPSSPTYQWKSSTDNVTFTNVGTNSATYTTPTLTQTTYVKLTITNGGGCTSTSAVSKITVLTTGGWLGTTSNWSTASNWCGNAVPTLSTDVVITNGAGITNMPVIGSGTSAAVRNLTISSTFPVSSLTLAGAADALLSIYGNFTNNGKFTDNTTAAAAGVKFAGTSAQTIAGSTANVFNNLTIANTSGANPAINITTNNVTVGSNLTMTSGLVNLNGYTLTLGTSAANPGALAYTVNTRFYGGNIARWLPTSSITIGTDASLFPIGTSTDYRPLYVGSTGLTTAGGTVKVRHTSTVGATAVAPTFSDNGGTVAVRSNSFWTVTTANGISSTGTPISIRTEGTGFGTVGAVTDLRQTRVNTIAPGTDGAHAGTTSNPQVNRTGLSVTNLSNDFYWGSINSVATPLPVTLVSFTGAQNMNSIDLDWTTASELKADHYIVEKSIDGKRFEELGIVQANGTTSVSHKYQLIDTNPEIGKNYYRLISVDLDNTREVFDVIAVNYQDEKTFQIFPNPTGPSSVNYRSNFELSAKDKISIMNQLGVVMAVGTIDATSKEIVFSKELPAGLYIFQYVGESATLMERLVVK